MEGLPPHVQSIGPLTSVGCQHQQKIKSSPFPSCLICPSFNRRLYIGQKVSSIPFRNFTKNFACGILKQLKKFIRIKPFNTKHRPAGLSPRIIRPPCIFPLIKNLSLLYSCFVAPTR